MFRLSLRGPVKITVRVHLQVGWGEKTNTPEMVLMRSSRHFTAGSGVLGEGLNRGDKITAQMTYSKSLGSNSQCCNRNTQRVLD